MNLFRTAWPAALAAAACAGPGLQAQAPAPASADDPARAYVYEVGPEQAAHQEAPASIEVSGTAFVSVRPDLALASFAVENQARTAGDAASANAEAMASVIAALEGARLPGLRIETFGYALRPDYSINPQDRERTRVISGYTAVNNVRVTVADVEAAGRVIDLAVGAGANRVSSLAFDASDTEEARHEALRRAVEAATGEARAIAQALGRELGSPLEVRGGAQAPSPRPRMEMAMEMARASVETPIEAGDQTVRASVSIRFALGGPIRDR